MYHFYLYDINTYQGITKPTVTSTISVEDWLGQIKQSQHIKFKDFLGENGYDTKRLAIYNVNDDAVGKYHAYLKKKIKARSYFNHHFRALKNFYNYLIQKEKYLIHNIAKEVPLLNENPDPKSIEDDDFLKILNAVEEKDSVCVHSNGVKKKMFRPYIKNGFELVAFTGMRLKEVAMLKYSDIVEDSNGQLLYLKGIDLKFELRHNWNESKPTKIVHIPITPELEDLLNRLKYKENKGSEKYLIDGDNKTSRDTLAKQMSHAFTFYRRKVGIADGISIKHLRKTFLTKLDIQTGLAQSAGYQKTKNVILKNYIAKDKIVEAIRKKRFSFFDKKASLRKDEKTKKTPRKGT